MIHIREEGEDVQSGFNFYPPGLADALEKLSGNKEELEVANKATAHLFIVNPFTNIKGGLSGFFDTHPPIEERIRILRAM